MQEKIYDGAPSDHAALALKMKLPNFKFIPKEKRNTMMKETKRINNKLLCKACSNVFKERMINTLNHKRTTPFLLPHKAK